MGNFSFAEAIMTPSCQISLLSLGNNTLLIASPWSPPTERNDLTLSILVDAGIPFNPGRTGRGVWQKLAMVGQQGNGGYSSLARLSTGEVLVMWEGPYSGCSISLATMTITP